MKISDSSPASAPAKNLVTRRRVLASLALAPLALPAVALDAPSTGTPPARHGKVAIVTGSSRNIGAAIAKRLGRDGYNVTINYLTQAGRAAEVVRQIEQDGAKAISVQADVSDPQAVKRLFDATTEAFGGVDVVVSNAGIMRLAPFATMTDEDFDRLSDVNFKGGFNVLREAARRVRDGGRIVATSSSITQLRTATYGPYAATKAALDIFVSCLAKELRGRMISVNAIAPGVVATPLFLDVPGRTEAEVRQFAQRTPHGRIGEPEDIAAVVSLLCGEDGTWINGQAIPANGGLV